MTKDEFDNNYDGIFERIEKPVKAICIKTYSEDGYDYVEGDTGYVFKEYYDTDYWAEFEWED